MLFRLCLLFLAMAVPAFANEIFKAGGFSCLIIKSSNEEIEGFKKGDFFLENFVMLLDNGDLVVGDKAKIDNKTESVKISGSVMLLSEGRINQSVSKKSFLLLSKGKVNYSAGLGGWFSFKQSAIKSPEKLKKKIAIAIKALGQD